jgi:prepilin-type N-terminal cleavage/methylation domain-containing protein
MKKMQKGFTLIELMIVIAIIAIIAAIAIPNLLASRIRANEATAISAIKQIATAQVTFQSGRQGRNAINTSAGASGFATNYRNLAFGVPQGGTAGTDKLALISDSVANAFCIANDGGPATAGSTGVAGTAEPYQGYQFISDSNGVTNWALNFAIIGSPSQGGTTGNNEYWVGQAGVVYIKGVDASHTAPAAAPAATATPSASPIPTDWATL